MGGSGSGGAGGGGTRTFANSLFHHVDLVVKQVEAGIYSVKRVISFAKRLAILEEEHSKGIHGALQHEQTKTEAIGLDGMKIFLGAFKTTRSLFKGIADNHKTIAGT